MEAMEGRRGAMPNGVDSARDFGVIREAWERPGWWISMDGMPEVDSDGREVERHDLHVTRAMPNPIQQAKTFMERMDWA